MLQPQSSAGGGGVRRLPALLLTTLVTLSCAAPVPSPTDGPTGTPSATEVLGTPTPSARTTPAGTTPTAGATPTTAPPVAANPTSADLINTAVQAGVIDEATGYLYRFYAQWSDARLPEAYQGDSSEDNEVAELAEQAFDRLSPDQQALLKPYLVRPTDPASYFKTAAASATRGTGHIILAQAVSDPRCLPSGAVRNDMPSIPVTVWGICRNVGGSLTYTLEPEVTKVMGFMTDLWPKMTGDMAVPIGDQFKNPGQQAPGEVDEAGDGRFDIYVVDTQTVRYNRDLSNVGKAVTKSTWPKEGGTSSGYIVYNAPNAGGKTPSIGPLDDAERKANLAHEFFHVLQYKYNEAGTISCPYPDVTGNCAGKTNQTRHWFAEASAAWAEFYYVPEARRLPYERFNAFLAQPTSLSDNVGTNAYHSYMWPLFMQQENNGPSAIAYAWRTLAGKTGWQQVQQTVSDAWPFDAHFRDFAVRAWNEDYDPGHPIRPLFRDPALDPNFPSTRPDDPSLAPEGQDPPRMKGYPVLKVSQNTYSFTEDIPELWAEYYDISPEADVRRLDFTFSGLTPNGSLDADALVKIKDSGWERRPLAPNYQICMDVPKDDVEEMILVLSNHSMQVNDHVTGTWTVSPSDQGCGTATDTLVFHYVREVGTPSDDYYSSTLQTMTLRVSLAVTTGGNDKYIPFLNDNSSADVEYKQHVAVKGIGGCVETTDTEGHFGGALPNEDSVVGGMAQQEDGKWVFAISASVEVPVTITQDYCIGGGSGDSTVVVQLPPGADCVGTEIQDSDPARIFDFNCVPEFDDAVWTVTGKVTANF